MEYITFLYALALFDLFTNVGQRPFPEKRPIYPQYGDEAPSSNNPKDLPDGFLPVLLKYDDNKFVSIDEFKRLEVNLPTQDEESVHGFEEIYFDFNEGANYYFFFTEAELTEAGFNISRKPGFNYWNPEALRWEPRGHVVDSYCADHRFYIVPSGYFAVCYTLKDGKVCSEHPSLPVFEQSDVSSAWCFRNFFGHRTYKSIDFEIAYFFIEFSLEELSNAGVEVPADLTGYRFNPEKATFKEVEKPATPCGWDWITECWRPICDEKDEEERQCCSGKPAFPWYSPMSEWILDERNDVFTYLTNDTDEARRNASLMQNFFLQNDSLYCKCKCYCSNCRSFHLPAKKSEHRPYENDKESRWTCG